MAKFLFLQIACGNIMALKTCIPSIYKIHKHIERTRFHEGCVLN